MSRETIIEAILFFKGEPVAFKELALLLKCTEEEVRIAVQALMETLLTRGLRVVVTDSHVTLVTSPEVHSTIEAIRKEELSRDLSRASAETLAIILYRGPIARSDIDHIRGVNSSFILRNLLVRGLIEKVPDTKDQRVFLYKSTSELLAHLGITKIEDLPEFAKVKHELETFLLERVEEDMPGEDASHGTTKS